MTAWRTRSSTARRAPTALNELGAAAGQLAGLIEDAKQSPNGAVHQLIYGDARGMFADLGSAAADLKKITSTVANGEGTLGGLISDPTVYEDLRQTLGNVKRNRLLRALVRFSVNNREELDQIGKAEGGEARCDSSRRRLPSSRRRCLAHQVGWCQATVVPASVPATPAKVIG